MQNPTGLLLTGEIEGGGLVEDLYVHTFSADAGDISLKGPTEVVISDHLEAKLADLGFTTLLSRKRANYSVFFTTQSCHKPKKR